MDYYDYEDWPTPNDECNWQISEKGNYVLLSGCDGDYDRELLATVYKSTKGWAGVRNVSDGGSRFLRSRSYDSPQKAAESLRRAIAAGSSSSLWASDTGRQWTPIKPKRKSDEEKQLGYWRKSNLGTLTVKPTKTGNSWFAMIMGEIATQEDGETPIWFRRAEHAMGHVDSIVLQPQ